MPGFGLGAMLPGVAGRQPTCHEIDGFGPKIPGLNAPARMPEIMPRRPRSGIHRRPAGPALPPRLGALRQRRLSPLLGEQPVSLIGTRCRAWARPGSCSS